MPEKKCCWNCKRSITERCMINVREKYHIYWDLNKDYCSKFEPIEDDKCKDYSEINTPTNTPWKDELDINKCPSCGGEADNGFDRCVPPNPYTCTKCAEDLIQKAKDMNSPDKDDKKIGNENLNNLENMLFDLYYNIRDIHDIVIQLKDNLKS